MWFMPFVAAIPFVCRLVQCLRVFRDTGATPQLYNALKYASALPAMWVWGLRGPMDPEAWTAHFQVRGGGWCSLMAGVCWCMLMAGVC